MNLIEQLGGYDAAKEKSTSWLLNHGENWRNVKDATLLEYRRQHNIFEVGDYVFHTVCNNPLLEKITWTDGVRIITNLAGRSTLIETFRHATDEEIKAGKRLGVGCEN